MSTFTNFEQLFSLKGKAALVTGGSRGIGLHTATAFLHAGCSKVYITARKYDGNAGLGQAVTKIEAIPGFKGKVMAIAADLSKESEIIRVIKTVMDDLNGKGLNIFVANAAAAYGGKFETTPDWSSAKILDLNVKSVFNMTRLLLPLLGKAASPEDPARVIIVGSNGGLIVPFTGDDGVIMYSASKAAAHHLAKNLAIELAPRNITTNALAPGFFATKLAGALMDSLGVEKIAAHNPLKRIGYEKDIGGIMVYLCSEAGSYMNGMVLAVDGGAHLMSAHAPRSFAHL